MLKFDSLFLDNKGRNNVLTYGQELSGFRFVIFFELDQEKLNSALNHKRFDTLKYMLDDCDIFRELTLLMNDSDIEDVIYCVRSMFNDFQILLRLIERFRLIMASFESIHENITLYQAIERISKVICSVLDCDRASLFLVNFSKNHILA